MSQSRVCSLCGTPCPPRFLPPRPEISPDLDLRPGEPTRSTMNQWMQTCAGCGAVAPDLSILPPEAIEVVESEAYFELYARPASATPFLKYALICKPGDRAGAYLQAAWAADDAGDDEAARHYRREAAAHWGEPDGIESALRLIDVLRRAGMFSTAEECCAFIAADAMDERAEAILRYQRARIAEADAGRHSSASAQRPPARTQQTAHGKSIKPDAKPGLFARLFGKG